VGDRRGVQRWDPRNERQLLLLRRIAGGDDLSGPDGVRQRTSARAPQTRGLVDAGRKDGVWRAYATDAAGSTWSAAARRGQLPALAAAGKPRLHPMTHT
jgi:hypothetical protein